MVDDLPPFTSTTAEIKLAVEQNAIDRGTLFVRVIVSLDIDGMLQELEQLALRYDKEEWREQAMSIGLQGEALDLLDGSTPPVPYVYYFSMPELLITHPRLIFYYRNIAMLSSKVMHGVGLDTSRYEANQATPTQTEAVKLSTYFNKIVSALVLTGGVTPHRHIAMLMANMGDSLGGVSRNEVGRTAMMRLLNPLVAYLHRQDYLQEIVCSFKDALADSGASRQSMREKIVMDSTVDIDKLLSDFEHRRAKYHELVLRNGSRLLIDRQLNWIDEAGSAYRIGPDLHAMVETQDFVWAAELKGGADPAGSDEHWKTATQALRRILDACLATGRDQPALVFIATIFVERVAREAQAWIDDGKLTAAYNLTRMLHEPEEMQHFCSQVTAFLVN